MEAFYLSREVRDYLLWRAAQDVGYCAAVPKARSDPFLDLLTMISVLSQPGKRVDLAARIGAFRTLALCAAAHCAFFVRGLEHPLADAVTLVQKMGDLDALFFDELPPHKLPALYLSDELNAFLDQYQACAKDDPEHLCNKRIIARRNACAVGG